VTASSGIPSPRSPLLDASTGLIQRDWFRYLQDLKSSTFQSPAYTPYAAHTANSVRELSDVRITASIPNGYVLAYSSADQRWSPVANGSMPGPPGPPGPPLDIASLPAYTPPLVSTDEFAVSQAGTTKRAGLDALRAHIRDDAYYVSMYPGASSNDRAQAAAAALVAGGGGRLVFDEAVTLTAPLNIADVSAAFYSGGKSAPPVTVQNTTGGIYWSSTRTLYPNHFVFMDNMEFIANATGIARGVSAVWPNAATGSPAQPHGVFRDVRFRPTTYAGATERFISPMYIENAYALHIVRMASQFNGSSDTVHIDLNYGNSAAAYGVFIDKPNLQSGAYGIRALGWMENLEIYGGECVQAIANVYADAAGSLIPSPGNRNPLMLIKGGHWNSASRNFDLRKWTGIQMENASSYIHTLGYGVAGVAASVYAEDCIILQQTGCNALIYGQDSGPVVPFVAGVYSNGTQEVQLTGCEYELGIFSHPVGRNYAGFLLDNSGGAAQSATITGNTLNRLFGVVPVSVAAMYLAGNGGASVGQNLVKTNAIRGPWTNGVLTANTHRSVVTENTSFENGVILSASAGGDIDRYSANNQQYNGGGWTIV
jgi:hypothetical protein